MLTSVRLMFFPFVSYVFSPRVVAVVACQQKQAYDFVLTSVRLMFFPFVSYVFSPRVECFFAGGFGVGT